MRVINSIGLRIGALILVLIFTPLTQAQMSGQLSIPPPAGMVSWWPGDGNANDIVDGNNGTLHGGATFASGMVGPAFLLDPASPSGPSFVDVGNASNLRVSAGDFSVDAWVKFNAVAGDMSIVDKSTSFPNLDGWRLIKQADNRFWFCFGGGSANRCYDPAYTIFSTTVATTGVWYHVAVVKTSSAFSIYVNGVLEDTRSPVPAFFDSNTADLLLGATGQAYPAYLNGLIDEVELFNRALSAAEIAAIFNAGAAGKCKVCAAPFAYTTDNGGATVSVIDTATNVVTATLGVGTAPRGVAVTPDGRHVYVVDGGHVWVIDAATNTVTAMIGPPGGAGVAVTPDGSHVYVTNFALNSVTVIATATNTVTAVVGGLNAPIDVAVTPDGRRVYVTNLGPPPNNSGNTVSVIATATNTVVATVAGLNGPIGVGVTPNGSRVYVANANDNSVSVINTATNTVTATVGVGTSPRGVAVTPDGAYVYVSNAGSGTVSVIATATNTVTATVGVGTQPRGVAVTPYGSRVYVANRGSGTISVIDTTTNMVTATVSVGGNPASFGKFIGPLPFAAFTSTADIVSSVKAFDVRGTFTLGTRGKFNPLADRLTVQLGAALVSIPGRSFRAYHGKYMFAGVLDDVLVEGTIVPSGGGLYAYQVGAAGVLNLPATNPLTLTVTAGTNTGTMAVTATFVTLSGGVSR